MNTHPAVARINRIVALNKKLCDAIKTLPERQREQVLLIAIELQQLAQEATRGALLGEIAP